MNIENIIKVAIVCFTVICCFHIMSKAVIEEAHYEVEKEKIRYKIAFGIRDEEDK